MSSVGPVAHAPSSSSRAGLATQLKTDFLRGRYVSANWDVTDLMNKSQQIIDENLLWTRVTGQEQVMPSGTHVYLAR